MTVYSIFVVLLLIFDFVEARQLTEREAKLLKNNCGRYVEGYQGVDSKSPKSVPESEDNYKVLYGKEASESQAPWAASIAIRFPSGNINHTASGTLVSPFHIVTAAHVIGISADPAPDCETGEMKSAKFLHGARDFVVYLNTTCADENACNTKDGLVPRSVSEVFVRKGYVGDGCFNRESFNDVAILVLAEPVEFSSHIYPACIGKTDASLENEEIRLFGYGRDPSAEGQTMGILKYQNAKFGICPTTFNTTGLLCVNPLKQGLACDGDSGAGYIHKQNGRKAVELVGVLSAGANCEFVRNKHIKEDAKHKKRTQEADFIVDVGRHNDYFCACCGLC
ncbi:unnamed protein product [Caenorhabditis angaria]|uniref:Peptidase S1 domain-containing protein n=1 Tax=Caenorhabditis angaria TaxID=860376 RepID=A0A9P1MXM4_9PELO|nr:unnamed protein product [Caenorhabditis angaria]